MVKPFPSKTQIANHTLHPETLMLNYGYDPQLSEGAVKPPVFLTSTFVFRTAEDGKDFFDFVSGRREPPDGMGAGLVYSRFNHPNSEIVEDRLSIYERAENCALFSSGMAAISTTILAFVRPGDVILTRSRSTAERKRCWRRRWLASRSAPSALLTVLMKLPSGRRRTRRCATGGLR